jgi:hypothetical protein
VLLENSARGLCSRQATAALARHSQAAPWRGQRLLGAGRLAHRPAEFGTNSGHYERKIGESVQIRSNPVFVEEVEIDCSIYINIYRHFN